MATAPSSAAAALCAVTAVAALGAAPAEGRRTPRTRRVTTLELRRSPLLWATVDVCDPPALPGAVGLRASMPGTGRSGSLWMSFRLQYLAGRAWRDVAGPERVPAGASRSAREAGVTWRLRRPAPGASFALRGLVTFEWWERGRLLLRLRRATTGGRRPSAGSVPPGYSAARCVMRSPAQAPGPRTGAGRS